MKKYKKNGNKIERVITDHHLRPITIGVLAASIATTGACAYIAATTTSVAATKAIGVAITAIVGTAISVAGLAVAGVGAVATMLAPTAPAAISTAGMVAHSSGGMIMSVAGGKMIEVITALGTYAWVATPSGYVAGTFISAGTLAANSAAIAASAAATTWGITTYIGGGVAAVAGAAIADASSATVLALGSLFVTTTPAWVVPVGIISGIIAITAAVILAGLSFDFKPLPEGKSVIKEATRLGVLKLMFSGLGRRVACNATPGYYNR